MVEQGRVSVDFRPYKAHGSVAIAGQQPQRRRVLAGRGEGVGEGVGEDGLPILGQGKVGIGRGVVTVQG